jgi:hypothetical protein
MHLMQYAKTLLMPKLLLLPQVQHLQRPAQQVLLHLQQRLLPL